jgi:sulfate adenylyltransferase
MGTMKVTDKYTIDKGHECMMVYKTTDLEHPGVKMVMAQGKYNLAGPVKVLSTGSFKEEYGDQFMTPAETRAKFEKLGWSKIAAFQTRNPMHRSATNTWPRSPSRPWTACWSTPCSAR